MQEYKFITNELIIKNNKGLKGRGQVSVEMEVERSQYHRIIPLETDYLDGTHFEVTIKPLTIADAPQQTNEV